MVNKNQAEVGGLGGLVPYDQEIGPNAKIVQLEVSYGDYVDYIEMTVQDGASRYMFHYGGWGGNQKRIFAISDNEYLAKMVVTFGDYIDSVQFFTNRSRASQIFGGHGHQAATLGHPNPDLPLGAYEIRGLHGNYAAYVDRLGVYFREVTQ